MSFLLDVLRIEALLQWRSLRFRIAAALFLLVTCTPPFLVSFVIQPEAGYHLGAASYLSWSLDVARFCSVLLAVVVAGNRSSALGQNRIWPVLSAAGVSNGGFLWRRWIAMTILLAGLTAVPVALAAGVAASLGLPLVDPMSFLGAWLLLLVAAAAMQAALWLALVTISGSELGAALMYVFVVQAAHMLSHEEAFGIFGSSFRLRSQWLGGERLQAAVYGFQAGDADRWFRGFQLATDGGFDWSRAIYEWWPQALPHVALAVLLMTIASAFLRRTRSDLRPLTVGPTHPLRNMMRYVHGFRHRYTPDAALRFEKLLMILGCLAIAAAAGLHVKREEHFRALADERFAVEKDTEQQWTTPLELAPASRKITGELRSDGSVDVRTRVVIRHRGERPSGRLAWRLDPFVELEVTAGDRRVAASRRWDRLFVEVDPPLEPGAEMTLEFLVSGQPREPVFSLGRSYDPDWPFSLDYRNYLRGIRRRSADLALSWNRSQLSGQRLDLAAYSLTPVPRYTTWELTPPPDLQGERGLEVRPEAVVPVEELEIDLIVPEGLFVADVCGHWAAAEAEPRLRGACRSSILDYRVRGSRLEVVTASEAIVVAAMPVHRQLATQQVPVIEQVASLSAQAWPSLVGLGSLVAMEWPPPFKLGDSRGGMLEWDGALGGWLAGEPKAFGSLLSIPESTMVSRQPMEAEHLVSRLLVTRLMKRRDIALPEIRVVRRILGTAMSRRMGMAGPEGSTISGSKWSKFWAGQPIEGKKTRNSFVVNRKVPAVTMDLMARVGPTRFYAAVDEFLAVESEEPGTLRELLEILERRTGVELEAWRADHLEEGSALPELRLENVSSRGAGGEFLVSGELRNIGSGQARCPIEVKAAGMSRKLEVKVGAETSTRFELRLERQPFTVILDPEKTCFRWVTKTSGLVERIALGETR